MNPEGVKGKACELRVSLNLIRPRSHMKHCTMSARRLEACAAGVTTKIVFIAGRASCEGTR
jgi:hypothetical protein